MTIFKFKRIDNIWHVKDTEHVKETRDGDRKPRNHLYTKEKLKEIFDKAICSMTQYRKDYISVTFFNEYGGTNAILCKLEESNIIIITMLHNVDRDVRDVFRNAKHVFLRDYIFKIPSRKEIVEDSKQKPRKVKNFKTGQNIKKKEIKTKILKIKTSEDEIFLNRMKNIKRI